MGFGVNFDGASGLQKRELGRKLNGNKNHLPRAVNFKLMAIKRSNVLGTKSVIVYLELSGLNKNL